MLIAKPQSEISADQRDITSDARNAVVCGMAVVAAIALTNPYSGSAFNDDWSYALTVKKLLETGHLIYNGWASASLIAQAYWALIWVKIFGFSQITLRLSTLPLAVSAISLCYVLARRSGLNARFAVFATLTIGISPLFLPVASSFMTDVPGLFFILLSIYLLLRAIESEKSAASTSWLISGLLVGLIGGTGRQIVWVVPLVMTPYAAWLRRNRLGFVLCALGGWLLVMTGVIFTLQWFAVQPYAIPEAPLRYEIKLALANKPHFALAVLAIPLTTVWVIFPALWCLSRRWTAARALISTLILLGPVLVLGICRPRYLVAPWMGNTLCALGVMGQAELHGERPFALAYGIRIAIAVAVFTTVSILLADLLIWLARPLTAIRKTIRSILYPDPNHALIPSLILFAITYCMLLLPRCAQNMVYDRYLLPLMPCIVFPLLLYEQKLGHKKVPRYAWAMFALFSVYGICITQDVTALDRARENAANRLIATGIPREQIEADFVYNSQTQVLQAGYINDPRIKVPATAWQHRLGPTPIVRPTYRLEFAPAPDTQPTPVGSIEYYSFIYPFHRKIYIDKFIDPWWLNPRRAATQPDDTRFQMMASTSSKDDPS